MQRCHAATYLCSVVLETRRRCPREYLYSPRPRNERVIVPTRPVLPKYVEEFRAFDRLRRSGFPLTSSWLQRVEVIRVGEANILAIDADFERVRLLHVTRLGFKAD